MRLTLLSLVLLLSLADVTAQSTTRVREFNLSKGIAIGGYDPVSYFDGKPVMGKTDQEYEHLGVRYRFSSSKTYPDLRRTPISTNQPMEVGAHMRWGNREKKLRLIH
ncbi:MAG: hypothetical protein QY309_16685 [Cyclobacteriaceae bacterium]|nr:MAG: hypothetical protein QY309_16685 [Cyclobacteriaceae bacterium]